MGTIVKFIQDAYPHGVVGDIRNLADKELAEVKKLAKQRKTELFEEFKPQVEQIVDKIEKEVELTADTVARYVKAHTRAELNQLATEAGVEEPEKLQNATAVAQALLDKNADESEGDKEAEGDKTPES